MIKHQVKLTASGAEGPTATKGPSAIRAKDIDTVSKDPEANANAACKNALAQAKAVVSPTKRIIAQKLAQALCKKVKAVVAKEIHTEKAMMNKATGKSTMGVHPAQSKHTAKKAAAV